MNSSAGSVHVGFDLGGQSLKAVAATCDGRLLATARRTTGAGLTLDLLSDAIGSVLDEFAPHVPKPGTIGLGVAGSLDGRGALRGSPNLPQLTGVVLADALSARLGVHLAIDNDANCAALAEAWCGAGSQHRSFLLVTLGTGLGAGLILDGELYRGAGGWGPELGHMIVSRGGRTCGCGNRGCLEAYVSDVAVSAQVQEQGGPLAARLAQLSNDEGLGAAQSLFRAEEQGLPQAIALAADWIEALGVGLASALNVFDVGAVVVGGGIAPAVFERESLLRQAMASALFARDVASVAVSPALCGADAGALGAAWLAQKQPSIGS